MSETVSIFGVWLAGLRIGLATLPRERLLGLKRLILPVSYWRAAEFRYVWNRLANITGPKVFDLGSPKSLALMLARHRELAVVATDILEEAVELTKRYASAQNRLGAGLGEVLPQVEDGRGLTFADNEFDAAYSVSVLEHIPDDGDSRAVRELCRIVKPGGIVVLTVPYAQRYRESFVEQDVYERRREGEEALFYERHYDEVSLRERLIWPSGATLVDLQLWGEHFLSVESLMQKLGPWSAALSPLEPLLATLCLSRSDRKGVQPRAAFLALRVR